MKKNQTSAKQNQNIKKWMIVIFVILGFGLICRFWNITANQFLFYDEGMYLGYNRNFLDLVAANPPKDINELFAILGLMFKQALGTAKALWFFILNLRVFFSAPSNWAFAREISALSGVATIVLTYLFAHRYFQSKRIAVLSAVFLSLLPSHVFYSRLGMQESLSALLFLSALYVYMFFKSAKWGVYVSAILLSCVYFTNYRMIIAPVFIGAIEVYEALSNRQKINWRRALICVGVFALIVFVVGSLYGGINRYVTFGWMFHQAQETKAVQGGLLNFLSYPYYTIALEGILFAFIFWVNSYLIVKKEWSKLLPFVLVLLQMGIFSLAAEKGARYLCVILPFMAIAAATSIDFFINNSKLKKYVLAIGILACVFMAIESIRLTISSTAYDKAVGFILKNDAEAKILSTQPLIEQLYIVDETKIKECPKNLAEFIQLYSQGYRYLILDPQAYISWTQDTQRFSPPLINFLELIHANVTPIVVLDHLNPILLKRFVLDHNQSLGTSISFLSSESKVSYGQIRIYDIGQCLMMLKQRAMKMELTK